MGSFFHDSRKRGETVHDPIPVSGNLIPCDKQPPMDIDRRSQLRRELTDMARAESNSGVHLHDALYDRFKTEWEADDLAYEFTCNTYGDFLSIDIKRGREKVNTSLNMGRVREISLTKGYAPDRNGQITFGYSLVKDDNYEPLTIKNGEAATVQYVIISGAGVSSYMRETPEFPGAGYHYKVTPMAPVTPFRRAYFMDAERSTSCECGGDCHGHGHSHSGSYSTYDNSWLIPFTLPNGARASQDDMIHFRGIQASIWTPAGLGESVKLQIMGSLSMGRMASRTATYA